MGAEEYSRQGGVSGYFAVLSLGSNIADDCATPAGQLERALRRLELRTTPTREVATTSAVTEEPRASVIEDTAPHTVTGTATETVEIVETSRVFLTPPWGGVEQEEFYNQCICVRTTLEPLELLRHCQAVERAARRRREIRWGPRTLDIDVLWVSLEEQVIREQSHTWGEELILPHPRAHERAFVLIPWLDLAISQQPWCLLQGKTIAQCLAEVEAAERAAVRPL